jgi:hypothetical protein
MSQNPTPELVNGHNEEDVPRIVGAAAREQKVVFWTQSSSPTIKH